MNSSLILTNVWLILARETFKFTQNLKQKISRISEFFQPSRYQTFKIFLLPVRNLFRDPWKKNWLLWIFEISLLSRLYIKPKKIFAIKLLPQLRCDINDLKSFTVDSSWFLRGYKFVNWWCAGMSRPRMLGKFFWRAVLINESLTKWLDSRVKLIQLNIRKINSLRKFSCKYLLILSFFRLCIQKCK